MQSVLITTNVMSSNPAHGEVYSIQRYVIKFVSDLRQVSEVLRILQTFIMITCAPIPQAVFKYIIFCDGLWMKMLTAPLTQSSH
jgi:hypothetical protein